MTDTRQPGPNWYPDPMGRHEYRWFDGTAVDRSRQLARQAERRSGRRSRPRAAPATCRPSKVQPRSWTRRACRPGAVQGGGTIFTEPVLVVNQKAKLIEVNNEYAISDQHGTQIGAVRQVGQSAAKKVLRVLTPSTSS